MSSFVSDSNKTSTPTKRTDTLLLAILIASLSLNVYLGWYAKRLNHTLGNQPTLDNLSPGMRIEPITAINPNGQQETISYENVGKPTVFYVSSPSCKWCERNIQNINMLVTLKGESFRFIGLSLSETGLKEYVDRHRFAFPIYSNLTPDSIHLLGLGSTPQTIVISPEGRVLKNWIGAYGNSLLPEVEAYFNIHLPGLTAGSN
jgi:hypothetical protein